jgi:hypothetical protein
MVTLNEKRRLVINHEIACERPCLAIQPRQNHKLETLTFHYQFRLATILKFGNLTSRTFGRMHHRGTGSIQAGEGVPIIINDSTVIATEQETAEILGERRNTFERICQPTKLETPAGGQDSNDDQIHHNRAPGRNRTCDNPLRRRVLYPTELQAL